MAIQFNVATRNARLDVIESSNGSTCSMEIRTGAPPANCAAANTGTVLSTINLPADWMAAASGGSKTISGTWQDLSCDAPGVAAHFRVFNSQVTRDGTTCFLQGTVSGVGGGGDMEVSNVNFVAGASFTVDTFTLTDGNA